MILRFLDCVIDTDRRVLQRGGEVQHVEPQVFDVLVHLISVRGRLVTKEELLDEVWGDRFVSESALTTRIKSARQAVGDSGSRQVAIRTVHGRGYEFIAAVEAATGEAPPVADEPAEPPYPPELVGRRLPVPVHALIGRDVLLERLREAVGTTRLLTLVGPGGVGKTSVAYELARMVADQFPDGVFAVELVSVVDATATLEALATALDVSSRHDGSLSDAIVDLLRPRRALLLLDNCEHLLEPIGDIVASVLRGAPDVTIVATSREALAVASEQVWPVDPLAVAIDSDGPVDALSTVPAIELFVERATAADPRFTLGPNNADAVVEICRRLDGVPLAIELAAARARAIDVAEIAKRLDERFRLLRGVRRGTDPRHRALDDTVRWSYDLLEPDEQQLFATLSVFAGQFDLDAAEDVCGTVAIDVLDALTRLAEQSMITVHRPEAGGTSYELLETLRAYGRSRLDDEDSLTAARRHTAHHTALALAVQRGLRGPDEADHVRRARTAFADLRAAQRAALLVGDLDRSFTLICAVREYAMRDLRYEALTWADAACAVDGADEHPLHPTLLGIRAYGAWVRGEFELAITLGRAVASAEQERGLPRSGLAERVLGNALYVKGSVDEGLRSTQEQLTLAIESGDDSRIAHAHYMHAIASTYQDPDAAAELAAGARAAADRTRCPTDVASALTATAFATSDQVASLHAFRDAGRIAAGAGNRWLATFARTEMYGLLLGEDRSLDEACRGLADSVDTWFRVGEWAQQWHTLARCVVALRAVGRSELACQVIGAIEAHASLGAPPVVPILRDRALETADALRADLGEDRYAELHLAGAQLGVVEVVDRTRAGLVRAAD